MVLQPIAAALIFAVIFGRLVHVPSDGFPYLVFTYVALLAWNYCASAVGRAGNSLVGQTSLVTKVYFPRVLIPFSGAMGALVDVVVSVLVALVMVALYGIPFSARLLAAPVFLALLVVVAMGTSLWLSALSVSYRDFIHATPFLLQVWMYATPVVYSTSLVPERWRWLFALNPMVGVVDGMRWSFLGAHSLTWITLLMSSLSAAALFFTGGYFFRRVERSFADRI